MVYIQYVLCVLVVEVEVHPQVQQTQPHPAAEVED
jgi:hypothetical protein